MASLTGTLPAEEGLGLALTQSRPDPTTVVLHVSGEIDLVGAPMLAESVDGCLSSAEQTVVVDLSAVSVLGSAGLNVLVQAQDRAQRERVTLLLVTGVHCVDRPLRACGLDRHFRCFPDLEAALAS